MSTIIFTPIYNFSNSFLEERNIERIYRYNLSSMLQAVQLDGLIPPSNILTPEVYMSGNCVTPEFDQAYYNYILSNDLAFINLMAIVTPIFRDPQALVQILIEHSIIKDIIAESLAKLIQQRYGLNAYFVNDFEDLKEVRESVFSIPGVFTMDNDLERLFVIKSDGKMDTINDDESIF